MPDASLAESTMFDSQESNYSTSLRSTTWAWGSFRKTPYREGGLVAELTQLWKSPTSLEKLAVLENGRAFISISPDGDR